MTVIADDGRQIVIASFRRPGRDSARREALVYLTLGETTAAAIQRLRSVLPDAFDVRINGNPDPRRVAQIRDNAKRNVARFEAEQRAAHFRELEAERREEREHPQYSDMSEWWKGGKGAEHYPPED